MGAKIVSIHSFRGGTGKSNTTANLAAQIALQGKRVGMVDTDIQSPGIHVLFGLNEQTIKHTLNDFLHGECGIEEVAYAVGENPEAAQGRSKLKGVNLWLLPASPKEEEIARILREGYDVNLLNKGIQSFVKQHQLDYLFIDTHPGLNDETLLSIAVSDALILILRPDQQDFYGTAVTADVARSLDVPKLFLLVNKALSKYDPEQIKQEVEQKYNEPVLAVLPLTENVADNASGDIFSLAKPEEAWSQRIQAAANALVALLN